MAIHSAPERRSKPGTSSPTTTESARDRSLDVHGWQLIETAPQDGTCVLIAGGTFVVSNSLAGVIVSAGVTMACYDDWAKLWRGENAGGHDEYYWPTHWMPLPAPPVLP